jgi:signal transduction histidine kinase
MSKSLQQKNTGYFLIWLPFVLLIGTVLFYVLMSTHAHHMEEEQLELKQENVWNAFMTNPEAFSRHITGEYDLQNGDAIANHRPGTQRDTTVYYPSNKEWVAFKILTREHKIQNETYQLTTYISSKEITHLIIKVFIADVLVFVLLLVAVVIINRRSSRWLWKPFHATMKQLRDYDITRNQSLPLPEHTGIREFDQLNQVLTKLIGHVHLAYNNQKQFVENAAHELQTPLAVIRSKLDLLINSSTLTEETAALLEDITQANDHLSQLNKNLLLLTKIDNRQFPDRARILLSDTLAKLISYYQAYYDGDLPAIAKSIQPGVHVDANVSLMEILINNLVNNAIVHNLPDGNVRIGLTSHELVIENTGPPVDGDTERLFERFVKGSEQSRTTGLGLSLVKRICSIYEFGLHYHYAENIHRVTVTFTADVNLQNYS